MSRTSPSHLMTSLPRAYPYRSLNPLKLSRSARQNENLWVSFSLVRSSFSMARFPGSFVSGLASRFISSGDFRQAIKVSAPDRVGRGLQMINSSGQMVRNQIRKEYSEDKGNNAE